MNTPTTASPVEHHYRGYIMLDNGSRVVILHQQDRQHVKIIQGSCADARDNIDIWIDGANSAE